MEIKRSQNISIVIPPVIVCCSVGIPYYKKSYDSLEKTEVFVGIPWKDLY
jgi:hypothetical protein